jgi:hypothetical protein
LNRVHRGRDTNIARIRAKAEVETDVQKHDAPKPDA